MSIEANKEVVRRYQEASNANDLGALDALVARDVVSHNPTPGLPPGLEGGKLAHRATLAAFPDLHYHIEDLVAEGDRVALRFTLHCTHQGEFMGLAPTGKEITLSGISIFRLADGKIVEHWAVQDGLALMIQLGVFKPPGAA
jgi:steroid delta-isomerase-like uncharacterized protein